MKKHIASVLAVLLIMLLVLATTGCSPSNKNDDGGGTTTPAGQQKPIEGALFDVLSTEDLDGTTVKGSEIKENRLVVLNFWATWCPPCTAELPELGKIAKEYKDQGVLIVGVLVDGTNDSGEKDSEAIQTAKQLLLDSGCDYLNILSDQALNERFVNDMDSIPTSVFLDADGNVVFETVGSSDYNGWSEMIEKALSGLPDA